MRERSVVKRMHTRIYPSEHGEYKRKNCTVRLDRTSVLFESGGVPNMNPLKQYNINMDRGLRDGSWTRSPPPLTKCTWISCEDLFCVRIEGMACGAEHKRAINEHIKRYLRGWRRACTLYSKSQKSSQTWKTISKTMLSVLPRGMTETLISLCKIKYFQSSLEG